MRPIEIPKNFNMVMNNIATMILACCICHMLCEIHSERVSLPEDIIQHCNHFFEVRKGAIRLSGEGRAGEKIGKQMTLVFLCRG
jgi:hypothetical protein